MTEVSVETCLSNSKVLSLSLNYNLVEKLEISIGQTIMILEKEMRTNENAKQTFLQHLPVPAQ